MKETGEFTKRIVCPVDTSECSRLALRQAIALAEADGAEVVVLYVYWEPRYLQPELQSWAEASSRTLWEFAEREARNELDAFLETVGKDVRTRVRVSMLRGEPAQTIVETANRERACLIVMGTHGRSGFSRLLLGSVAAKVIRLATCPVLTMRAADTGVAA